ncbi:MAG: hypothetical protein QOD99_3035 [Chthoniobacter sp.]|jgi:nitrous oxidase accessory protein NosD|nr:hypothetical protein [Chthoniobacter sp.]
MDARPLLVALFVLISASTGWTQTKVINSLPYTIKTPGTYRLHKSLSYPATSGNAITVNASNVTIDLGGFSVIGTMDNPDLATRGITAEGREFVTIRNGTIRGFRDGVVLDGGRNHLVENTAVDSCITTGIVVSGSDSIVRDNRVSNISSGQPPNAPEAIGLNVSGAHVRVKNNDVTSISAAPDVSTFVGGVSYGIFLDAASEAMVEGNRVTGISAFGNRTGANAYGISLKSGCPDAIVANNRIGLIDAVNPFGVEMQVDSIKYRDNIVVTARYSYSGGTDVGNNQ